jgi:hypothetical protein
MQSVKFAERANGKIEIRKALCSTGDYYFGSLQKAQAALNRQPAREQLE